MLCYLSPLAELMLIDSQWHWLILADVNVQLVVECVVIVQVSQGQSLVPLFGCLSSRTSSDSAQMMHAWDLFLRYYENKVRLSLCCFCSHMLHLRIEFNTEFFIAGPCIKKLFLYL